MKLNTALIFCLAWAIPAAGFAQSNAAPRNGTPKPVPRRNAPPAASQPTRAADGQSPAPPMPLVGAVAVNNRMRNPGNPTAPPPNVVLQQYSYFAVAEPTPQQININDTITVVIREDKTATSDAQYQADKEWDINGQLAAWMWLENGGIVTKNKETNPAVIFNYQDEYDGQGQMDRQDTLATRLQARVLDVKPNGNLVLEAKKSIKIDDDGYEITFTGECRAIDVTPANTVLSTQVADAAIRVEHHGAVRAATRRGWLKKVWDVITPF